MKLKFGLTENDAELQHHCIFLLKPELNPALTENWPVCWFTGLFFVCTRWLIKLRTNMDQIFTKWLWARDKTIKFWAGLPRESALGSEIFDLPTYGHIFW